jgi:hypothetical protein
VLLLGGVVDPHGNWQGTTTASQHYFTFIIVSIAILSAELIIVLLIVILLLLLLSEPEVLAVSLCISSKLPFILLVVIGGDAEARSETQTGPISISAR